MQLLVAGLSYRTAPVASRERFASLADRGAEIASLAARKAGITETLVLATCNRVELYGVATTRAIDPGQLVAALGDIAGVAPDPGEWYVRTGEAAIAHLFRVAAGLDAMAVGETQVLSQLKMAFQRAWEAGTTGPVMNRTLHRAFFVAKRVHTEGTIGAHSVSMASIAAAHAAKLVGDARRAQAIVVGTGEMGTAAARRLVREGFAEVAIAGRSTARAASAATASGAQSLPWGELFPRLAGADVVIAATSAKKPIFSRRQIATAQMARRKTPLRLFDLGTPRNVAPALKGATGVDLISIDDLRPIAERNLAGRQRAAREADALVAEEAQRFAGELAGVRFAPTVAALARKFEAVRAGELRRLFRLHPELSEAQRAAVASAANAIVAKILHGPAGYLKDRAHGDDERFMSCDLLARIFNLNP